jgi:N-acetylmuramic acid 6-phosphate (MurNAc-6-P) etherase
MEEKKSFIRHINEKKIQVLKNAIVPENNTFNIVNSEGVLVKKLGAGSTNTLGVLDCALVDCPPTFPPDTRCWHCQVSPDEERVQ